MLFDDCSAFRTRWLESVGADDVRQSILSPEALARFRTQLEPNRCLQPPSPAIAVTAPPPSSTTKTVRVSRKRKNDTKTIDKQSFSRAKLYDGVKEAVTQSSEVPLENSLLHLLLPASLVVSDASDVFDVDLSSGAKDKKDDEEDDMAMPALERQGGGGGADAQLDRATSATSSVTEDDTNGPSQSTPFPQSPFICDDDDDGGITSWDIAPRVKLEFPSLLEPLGVLTS
jgi:hypothetical protein